MEIIVITKNGKTFIEQTKELYEKTKNLTSKDGYRLATKQEIEAKVSKEGFKPEPAAKEIKQKSKPKQEIKAELSKEDLGFPNELDNIEPNQDQP